MPYLRTFARGSELRLRVGVISDIHERGSGSLLDAFVSTLKWYDRQKVDAVIVAGDLTDFDLIRARWKRFS